MKYTGEIIAILIVVLIAVIIFITVPGSLSRAEYRIKHAPQLIASGVDKTSVRIVRIWNKL